MNLNLISRALNYARFAGTSRLIMVSTVTLALAGAVVGYNLTSNHTANAASRDTSANSIIRGGALSNSEFVTHYNRNVTGDLPAVFNHYGLAPSELNRFAKTAKFGVAYKDGTLKVGGKTVATNVSSLGRQKKSGDHAVNIAGRTYYEGSNQTAFNSNSIPAIVMMNGDQFEFGFLTACANPMRGNPTSKPPSYACNMLTATQNTRTNYTFSVNANAAGGAKISHYVYEFGDGTRQQTTATSVPHTYAQPGNYTAKVTVYVTVNGSTIPVTGPQCTKPVEVKPEAPKPVFECTSLTFGKIERNKFRFTVTAAASGGASLKDANFDFGDGETAENITPTGTNQVSIEHTYDKAGPYTIVATVNPAEGNGVTSLNCKVEIKVIPEDCKTNPNRPECQPPKEECKPGIPKGDERCKEKPAPSELPSTGPAEFIGGALGLGSLTSASLYWVRSRKNLISALLNR